MNEKKNLRWLGKAVVITTALLFMIPGASVFGITPSEDSSQNQLNVGMMITAMGATGHAGDIGVRVSVNGTWDQEIYGYSVKMSFEYAPIADELTVTTINLDGCIVPNPTHKSIQKQVYANSIIITAYVDFVDPVPAGSGKLLNILVNVNSNATSAVIPLALSPWSGNNWYLNADGEAVYATLYDGQFVVIGVPLGAMKIDNYTLPPQNDDIQIAITGTWERTFNRYRIAILYDSSNIHCMGYTTARTVVQGGSLLFWSNAGGQVVIWYRAASPISPGSGTLLYLNFTREGSSSEMVFLNFTDYQTYTTGYYPNANDWNGVPIVPVFQNGTIDVQYNAPPDIPEKPTGPTNGLINVEYSFSSKTNDQEGDQIYYKWDWGNEQSAWLGPYTPNIVVTANHTWTTSQLYHVKVKAKDSLQRK